MPFRVSALWYRERVRAESRVHLVLNAFEMLSANGPVKTKNALLKQDVPEVLAANGLGHVCADHSQIVTTAEKS
jgi:hypothetical protein